MLLRSWLFHTLFTISLLFLLLYLSSALNWLMFVLLPVFAISLFHFYKQCNQLRILSNQRQSLDFSDFLTLLNEPGHDVQLVQAVYQQTLGLFAEDFRRFPLLPDDGFVEDLQLEQLDIEAELICNIAQQTHVDLAHRHENPLNHCISTPRQLINWFEQQIQINQHYIVS